MEKQAKKTKPKRRLWSVPKSLGKSTAMKQRAAQDKKTPVSPSAVEIQETGDLLDVKTEA